MNKNIATVVALVVLLVVSVVLYERNKSREIQASLAALSSEREALKRQITNLTRLVAEAKERPSAAPATAVEAPVAKPAPKREEPVATPGVSITAPKGWGKNGSKPGDYVVGVDETQSIAGLPSAYVKSLVPGTDGFGGMMQMSSAEDFSGKRVRLSGWAKTEDANDGGGRLWLRVDGKERGVQLQFDNMEGRAIKGTTDWRQYSVVLDVPAEAGALAYGFFVQGTGKMWVSGTKLEPVGTDVPSTNLIRQRSAGPTLPKAPVNLTFGNGP